MKAIFTFVTNGGDLLKDSFGWLSPKYHAYSWVYAVQQAKKYFGRTELYCDSQTASYVELLGIDLDEIYVHYDNLNLPKKLWSIPKVLTYSKQREPFLHLDADVYFRSKPDSRLFREQLIVQEKESPVVYNLYYKKALDIISEGSMVIPAYLLTRPNYCYNMGIFGGKDLKFIQDYSIDALSMIDSYNCINDYKNLFRFEDASPKFHKGIAAAFVEQYILTSKCEGMAYEPYCLLPTVRNALYRKGWEDIYQHFFFTQKGNKRKCKMLEGWVKNEYPSFYKKINRIFNSLE